MFLTLGPLMSVVGSLVVLSETGLCHFTVLFGWQQCCPVWDVHGAVSAVVAVTAHGKSCAVLYGMLMELSVL